MLCYQSSINLCCSNSTDQELSQAYYYILIISTEWVHLTNSLPKYLLEKVADWDFTKDPIAAGTLYLLFTTLEVIACTLPISTAGLALLMAATNERIHKP